MNKKDLCLDTLHTQEGTPVLNDCSLNNNQQIVYNQLFIYTKQHQIQNDENCVECINGKVSIKSCIDRDVYQKWIYDTDSLTLTHEFTKLCLDISDHAQSMSQLVVKECESDRISQKWLFRDNFEWQSSAHLQQSSNNSMAEH